MRKVIALEYLPGRETKKLTKLCPYSSLIAREAQGTSSNSTKHIGPLIFCLNDILLYPAHRLKRPRRDSSRKLGGCVGGEMAGRFPT